MIGPFGLEKMLIFQITW